MSQYMEALESLEQLESTSGRNAKYDILQSNVNNFFLTSILFLTYNNNIQFYIKKVNLKQHSEISTDAHFYEFLQLLEKLSTRELTGNAAKDAVKDTLESCSEIEQKWFVRVIKKDLKMGVALLGINKAMGNFIPEYTVQLAEHIEDLSLTDPKTLSAMPEEFVVEPKLDGMRLIAEKVSGVLTLRTRNGKVVEGYNRLAKELVEIMPDNCVLDGELMSSEFMEKVEENTQENTDDEIYQTDRECFQNLMSDAFRKGSNKDGIYNVFDIIPYSEWKSHETTQPLTDRKEWLYSLGDCFENIKIVKSTRVFHKSNPKDLERLSELFKAFLRLGYEGAMVKNATATYNFSRNNNLLKMKIFKSADLEVLRVCEGDADGKYKGTLGAVVVDYKGYEVNVGSGFDDKTRDYYWKHPEEIIGKMIEVSYQSESRNKAGGLSLSFPTFVCVRLDK